MKIHITKLLEIFSILWIIWSFKLISNSFSHVPGTEKNTFLIHNEVINKNFVSFILESSVCNLGTYAAIIAIIYSFINIYHPTLICQKHHIFILYIYSSLTFILNFPLFFRTIPWFLIRIFLLI
jgi:hypothetical protein